MKLTLFLEVATGRLWRARYDESSPAYAAKRGDVIAVDVVCVGRGTPLTSGAAVAFVLKRSGHYDAAPVAAVSDFAWDAEADRWKGTLTLLTVPLDALLNADATLTNDIAAVSLMGELAHKAAAADESWVRSQQVSFAVQNAVFRGASDLVPISALPALYDAIKAMLLEGTNITITANDTAKTITINHSSD